MDSEMTAVTLALTVLALSLLALVGLVVADCLAQRREANTVWGSTRITPAERAEALLREFLDEREYEQWTRRGYVDVVSPHNTQRIYRIPGYVGLVRMYENGIAIRELCLRPVEPLPGADVVVMHKLMIQGDEQEYLALAHTYPYAGSALRYRP